MPIPGRIFSLLLGSHYAVEATICQKFAALISPAMERCFSNRNGCLGTPKNRVASAQFFRCVAIARPTAAASTFGPSFFTACEKLRLEELQFIDQQISKLDQELANLLSRHNDAVVHLAEIPGLGVDSAQQIIAEVGAGAATFPSAKQLSSWVGACPGDEESAEVSKSHRSPKGNRHMRRILNQAANAAVKSKGTIFEIIYRRLVSRLGHNQTIGAVAHRLCRLIWIILH